ncbi:MAG: PASTA domain-containing protein, partial [Synergistaceae bacterium]|nr:PASTA domain-containing protein [Synergistaceae bacterium]
MRRGGGIVLTTLFIVVGIIFASGAIAVYTVFMKPESQSQVPALKDRSTVDAVAEAENAGFVVQLEPVASTLPEGRVLAQSPAPGTELRKGQVIVLQVSRGGELHAIPDVKGMTLAKAQEEIKAQGFSMGDVVRVREPKITAGTVIAQSPSAPAQISAGRKIDLLVQDGAGADGVITVPDVNRMTEKEAREALETVGVKVNGVDRVYS